jgi:glycosyltransferase involved in cell wall biosynthesis
LNWQGTVHHGFPPDTYKASNKPGEYLAFLGRTSPEKGLDRAIDIAHRSGMPLKIAAKIDKADQEYFDSGIKPLLNSPNLEFLGEIGYPEKNEFLANAAALLFPIAWPEPFGIVMIEALACGTPVIAYPFGSVPEVVQDGVNGYIVPDLAGAVRAVENIGQLDRKKVRKSFEQRFTASRMTQDYLKIYNRLLSRKKAPLAVADGVLNWMKLTSPSSTT